MKKINLIFYLVFFCSNLFAQEDLYISPSGSLVTHNGASMGIFGNIINDAPGGLNHQNAGNVYFYRRAANGTGNSRITDGPLAPVYSGNYNNGGAYVRFWNLFTDNTTGTGTPSGTPINGPGGSGQISVEQECRVSGLHSFVNGIVWTPRNHWKHAYLHYDNSGAGYSGNTDAKHIDGYAAKSGTGDFDFPIGDGNLLRMSGLRSPANGIFKSAYFAKNAYTGTSGISGNNGSTGPLLGRITKVAGSEFWDIDGTAPSYFMLSSLNSIAGYSEWGHASNFSGSNPGRLIISGYDAWDTLGINSSPTSLNSDGQFVTTSAITPDPNYSAFTWASKDPLLPITFAKFNAVTVNCRIQLNWELDNTTGLQHFEIQASENGINFISLLSVTAGNNTIHTCTVDQAGQRAFYRIKLSYEDGSYNYGPVLPAEKRCSGENVFSFKVYPNPLQDYIRLFITGDKHAAFSLSVLNAAGQRLVKKNIIVEKGNNLFTVDISELPAADYYLNLIDDSGIQVQQSIKIIKTIK